jgi:LacI family transcriptional regulator
MRESDITIYDLAKIVNVSATTVSRALRNHSCVNLKTRKKIKDLAFELGYQPNQFASYLARKKTNLIGVMVHELNSYFMLSVLSGIEKVANAAKVDLIICNSADSAEKESANAAHLFSKRVDGIIASLAFGNETLSNFDAFNKKKVPVVFFDRVESVGPNIKILIDNYKAGYEAALHLIHQGCKRIVHITGDLKTNVYAERCKGFQKALNEFGITFNMDQVISCDFSENGCNEIAQQIIQRIKLPDGIFIANDLCAAICIHKFKEAGIKIPEDIAIIGFNNDIISRIVDPQITTIDYPGKEMGELAAGYLIDQLSEEDEFFVKDHSVILKSNLIIRGSTQRDKTGIIHEI